MNSYEKFLYQSLDEQAILQLIIKDFAPYVETFMGMRDVRYSLGLSIVQNLERIEKFLHKQNKEENYNGIKGRLKKLQDCINRIKNIPNYDYNEETLERLHFLIDLLRKRLDKKNTKAVVSELPSCAAETLYFGDTLVVADYRKPDVDFEFGDDSVNKKNKQK